jgi:hypothetical protein
VSQKGFVTVGAWNTKWTERLRIPEEKARIVEELWRNMLAMK